MQVVTYQLSSLSTGLRSTGRQASHEIINYTTAPGYKVAKRLVDLIINNIIL